MRFICEYNPVCDVQPVDPTGWVDLALANSMNAIPANLEGSDLSYNRIEDPRSIAGRPSDIFDTYQASKVYEDYNSTATK